ncbi:hypothetical protein SMI10712_01631 [Streptococcus mitis]|uniref:Uncharacterized protein n=1 Tax=Streptococcus mitis TaxID=28037 RepID=A0A150NK11_STRMT|nr:hypothetical protein SMI10712_01631 [Streptococcus mitis]
MQLSPAVRTKSIVFILLFSANPSCRAFSTKSSNDLDLGNKNSKICSIFLEKVMLKNSFE